MTTFLQHMRWTETNGTLGCHLGSSHFSRDGHCFSVVLQVVFCIPHKTSFCAAQGMECGAHASGLVEVIRGPRPPSVQWPKGTGKGKLDDWLKPFLSDNTLLARVLRFIESLLHIRETSFHAAQSVVEGRCAIRMGPDGSGPRPKSEPWPRRVTMPKHQPLVAQKSPVSRPAQVFARSAKENVNPDVARCAALTQVQKLEKALEIMGDAEGPAVEALKLELDKARRAAKVLPLSVQITATQGSSNVRRNG